MDKLNQTDLRIDTTSGTAAVRITHLPTGSTVESSEFPSQMMNRCFALGVLTERVGSVSHTKIIHKNLICDCCLRTGLDHVSSDSKRFFYRKEGGEFLCDDCWLETTIPPLTDVETFMARCRNKFGIKPITQSDSA